MGLHPESRNGDRRRLNSLAEYWCHTCPEQRQFWREGTWGDAERHSQSNHDQQFRGDTRQVKRPPRRKGRIE